jgi:Do/DeqQ family serine protease
MEENIMTTNKKMNSKQLFLTFVFGLLGGLISLIIYENFISENKNISENNETIDNSLSKFTNAKTVSVLTGDLDFTQISKNAIDAVVHVKTTYYADYDNPFYNYFYGGKEGEELPSMEASGSGVILTADGYIVTNNHVIEDATALQVVLNNKKSYDAKIIGTDPSTDLALLKIEATDLSVLTFGNSDNLQIGEWVLAVGNPFNLTSTVTAGIVSAKARNIDLLDKSYAIESFIQTDAAVNPGNSGGALINVTGELVGINTAIASYTGSYSGYSFAIPVSIVQKVVADLMEYGTVQRALLGVSIQEIDDELAKKYGIDDMEGVFVSSVSENGAAKEAGIQMNDIIIKIGEQIITEVSELQEKIGQYSPGDEVIVTVKRDGLEKEITVKLRNQLGGTDLITNAKLDILGATFEELTEQEMIDLGIKNGVKVTDIKAGKFLKSGIKVGYIITKINDVIIKSITDVEKEINSSRGGVYIEGVYPDGTISYYAFGLK